MKTIEVIARALIMNNDKILLCKTVVAGNHFLPGGHVEFGESAEDTLVREMQEEANATVSDFHYIGLFQNAYGQGEQYHHEVNILYTATIADDNVISREPHITFEWIPIEQLPHITFLPTEFAVKILEYTATPKPIYLSAL